VRTSKPIPTAAAPPIFRGDKSRETILTSQVFQSTNLELYGFWSGGVAYCRRSLPSSRSGTTTFQEKYGGKRAFLCNLMSLALLWVGGLKRYQAVDWSKVERLVFICKGNICRSPYAQAKVIAKGFPTFSCGLTAKSGVPADPRAVLFAAERNISLTSHRATHFREFTVRKGDLIVCMEMSHATTVAVSLPDQGTQLTLLGLWARPRRPWLFDPYNLDRCCWSMCLDIIDSAVDRILELIDRQRLEAQESRR
jgi:protein-tyrosine phosphatase